MEIKHYIELPCDSFAYTPSEMDEESPLHIYTSGRYVMALFDIFGHDDLFTDTGDLLYFTIPFTIPKDATATITFPHSNMGITGRMGRLIGDVWVDGYDLKHITTEAGEERVVKYGEYVIYAKKKEDLKSIQILIHEEHTLIDEPIGFDSLKMVMKRGEYHGMSAEVSEQTLEFYGKAIDIIMKAYEDNIDTELVYFVNYGEEEVYRGVLDLSTFEELKGNYHSISCKVGEIGPKTTFNNRTKTEVNLNTTKTIDGEECAETPSWMNLKIPRKSLLYTNLSDRIKDETYTKGGGYQPYPNTGIYIGTSNPYIFFPIGNKNSLDEFGEITENQPYTTNDITNLPYQYTSVENHEELYGINTKTQVDIKLSAELQRMDNGWAPVGHNYIRWHLEAIDTDGNKIIGEEHKVYKPDVNELNATWDLSCELHGELNADKSIKYYLKFDIDLGEATSQYFYAHIIVLKDSYVKMTMYDNLKTDKVYAKMALVYDCLNTICSKISENVLLCRSDWYGRGGGGELKALTNGYKIRGISESEDEDINDSKRSMSISFGSIIESLDALDCIGWGFSNEEGNTYVRVERWKWFYKNDVILEILNPNEVKRIIDAERIFNELNIGYKKYETSDAYNSIDSVHGERTFISPLKSISNAKSVSCEFIADNYAIEETRRAKFTLDETEEFKYDENIFIFELHMGSGTKIAYFVANNLISSSGVGRPSEYINVQLSPRRCAERWRDFLFAADKRAFAFSTGKNNYDASFKCNTNTKRVTYLDDPVNGELLDENAPIEYTSPLFRAETIEFTYPITIAQYKSIKSNPYGLIQVNGILGWIKEFSYTFITGEANFVLIPKA